MAVPSSASSQLPRYVQLEPGGLGIAGVEWQTKGSVPGLRRAATIREMWGGSVASFSKRTRGFTLPDMGQDLGT